MTIVVYGTPSCGQCHTTKTALRRRGITFTDVDLSHESVPTITLSTLKRKYGDPLTLPVVEVFGGTGELTDAWQGFRPDKITTL